MKSKSLMLGLVGVGLLSTAIYFIGVQQKPDFQPGQAIIGANVGVNTDGKAQVDKSKVKEAKNEKSVSVTTVLAKQMDYEVKLQANGTVVPLNMVEVRPQISSVIAKVHVKEGQFVKAGDVLFTLDNRADVVNVEKAQAQLEKEMATLIENERQLARAQDLLEKKFQSQSVVDAAHTTVRAQRAQVETAKATLAAAKVNLSYTHIRASQAGRTGSINVFPGSLVQPSGAAMVTITQVDPIAVAFSLPQQYLTEVMQRSQKNAAQAKVKLPNQKETYQGQLQFVDNVVDTTSGTIKSKATFANQGMKLWPGAYVSVELLIRTIPNAIVIPKEALVVGVKGHTVYVVGQENKAEIKNVEIVYAYENEAIISGIDAGTKIVVDGKQNVRPGVILQERLETLASNAAPTKASSVATHAPSSR